MGKSTISMVIFNSYVKLPEGTEELPHTPNLFDSLVLFKPEKNDLVSPFQKGALLWGISFGPLASHSATSASVTRLLGTGDMAIFDHFPCRMLGRIFHSYQFQLDRCFFLLEGFLQDPFSSDAKSDSSGSPWNSLDSKGSRHFHLWRPGIGIVVRYGLRRWVHPNLQYCPQKGPLGSKRIFTRGIMVEISSNFPETFGIGGWHARHKMTYCQLLSSVMTLKWRQFPCIVYIIIYYIYIILINNDQYV